MAVERETFFLRKQKEAIEYQFNNESFSSQSKENLNAYLPRTPTPARNTQDDSLSSYKCDQKSFQT